MLCVARQLSIIEGSCVCNGQVHVILITGDYNNTSCSQIRLELKFVHDICNAVIIYVLVSYEYAAEF